MGNPAENIAEKLQTENPQNEDKKQNNNKEIEKKLTANELASMKKGVKLNDIMIARDQKAKAAKNNLDKLLSNTKDQKSYINLKEYRALNKKIDETESAEKME
jgi:hypothetical protein